VGGRERFANVPARTLGTFMATSVGATLSA
jgi:hypothetical protein